MLPNNVSALSNVLMTFWRILNTVVISCDWKDHRLSKQSQSKKKVEYIWFKFESLIHICRILLREKRHQIFNDPLDWFPWPWLWKGSEFRIILRSCTNSFPFTVCWSNLKDLAPFASQGFSVDVPAEDEENSI